MPITQVQVIQNLEELTSRRREAANAAPAPARIRLTVKTQGLGEIRLRGRRALGFGAILLEEPSFTYGLLNQMDHIPANAAPIGTAMVLRWRRSASGMYIGAEMAFCIFLPLMPPEDMFTRQFERYSVKWSLTFEGMTLRSTAGTGYPSADSIPY